MSVNHQTTWVCDLCGVEEVFYEVKESRPGDWAVLQLSRALNFSEGDRVYRAWTICAGCRLEYENKKKPSDR